MNMKAISSRPSQITFSRDQIMYREGVYVMDSHGSQIVFVSTGITNDASHIIDGRTATMIRVDLSDGRCQFEEWTSDPECVDRWVEYNGVVNVVFSNS